MSFEHNPADEESPALDQCIDEIKSLQAENRRLSERLAAAEKCVNGLSDLDDAGLCLERGILFRRENGKWIVTDLDEAELCCRRQDEFGEWYDTEEAFEFDDWYSAYQAAEQISPLPPAEAEQQGGG